MPWKGSLERGSGILMISLSLSLPPVYLPVSFSLSPFPSLLTPLFLFFPLSLFPSFHVEQPQDPVVLSQSSVSLQLPQKQDMV